MHVDEPECDPPFDSLGARLNFTARTARALLDARLHDAGTTAATWFVLVNLAEAGPLVQRDLAGRMRIEAPTLVRHLDKLEAEGLVARSRSSHDRRATLVDLTDAGRQRYLEARARVEETDADLAAVLTADQRRTVAEALELLARRARELHPRRAGR